MLGVRVRRNMTGTALSKYAVVNDVDRGWSSPH